MIKEAKIVSLVSLFPLPQYVVVLQDKDKTKLVPIWIGAHEGNAIAIEMQGEKFPRPLTHDLILNILEKLQAKIEKVVVTDLKEGSYYALIFINYQGKTIQIDARPSDSLALAVRLGCPIYIDEQVLKKCPTLHATISKDEIDKFKEEIKAISPEEFFKKLESTPPPADDPSALEGFGMPPLDIDDEEEEDDDEEEAP